MSNRGNYFGGSAAEPELPVLTESRKRGPVVVAVRDISFTPEQLTALDAVFENNEKLYESEIERQFGMAAASVCVACGLRIVPQYQLFGYRYDFAILLPKVEKVLALVECDGKEFHSTSQQLANDRQKDAAAAHIGAFVVRYTGAAIMRDARNCARNLVYIIDQWWRFVR
jgi:very-short-patch-repair endonuclease